MQDICPMKCSAPFFVKPVEEPNVVFRCPYNSQMCDKKITSIKNFEEHFEECEHISFSQLNLKNLQK